MRSDSDVIVLGAGGAGLFCAITAAKRGRSVVVLDHNDKPGKKILISGGGRCNFTNIGAGPEHYRCANPHFPVSALKRYTPQDFLGLVESHGIAWHEKTLGQLFCDGSAKQIVALLMDECARAGAQVRLSQRIDAVERIDGGDAGPRFRVRTADGDLQAQSLVIALGGLSIPTIGATDLGYRLARQFGLRVLPTAPALVPLTLPPEELRWCGALSGVSCEAIANCGERSFREALLFTHHGLSGPVILQISSWWDPGDSVTIDLLPGRDLHALLVAAKRAGDKRTLANQLGDLLPARLVEAWVARHRLPERIHQLGDGELRRIAQAFHDWTIQPSGTEGYRKAEVTRGGIDTDELSSKTMEARQVPGLYAIGEAVDVTGWLGGYNFQWAWASANACGNSC